MATARRKAKENQKLCFVTVGATASFNALVEACFAPDFLRVLQDVGYTHLVIQYGKDFGERFKILREAIEENSKITIDISGFDFKTSGTLYDMRAAKGHWGGIEGSVISHAGSGTILEALRIDVPLIVVPNTTLMHNHQLEVAEVLEEYGYVVHGCLDKLHEALRQIEQMRQRRKIGPPVNSGKHRQTTGLSEILDEELGFLD